MGASNSPSELHSDVRTLIGESTAGFWADDLLMRRMHAAQQEIVRAISEENPTFFTASFDISLVADQATYALPLPARLGTRWIAVENRISGEPYFYAWDIDLRRRLYGEALNVPSISQSAVQVTLDGDQLRVVPIPDSATTNALRLVYEPQFGNMLQGAASTITSTSLILSASAPDYSTGFGVVDRRDDYYNGMDVTILAGTGVGHTRRISDYTGLTRSLTVDQAWTTAATPTVGSTYAVQCPVPEDFRDLVSLRTAHGLARSGDKGRGKLLGEDWKDRLWDLRAWAAERSEFRGTTVEPMGGAY